MQLGRCTRGRSFVAPGGGRSTGCCWRRFWRADAGGGIVLSLAASPPVAARLGLEPFYFVNRHVALPDPGARRDARRPRSCRRAMSAGWRSSSSSSACVHGRGDAAFGAEVKGARRWIVLLGVNIQPSEFLKPAFVILVAWLFGESARRPEMPANTIALGLLLGRRHRAGAAARLRPDHAGRAGLGRAVLPRRHAHHLGGRARRRRPRSASRPPICWCPHVARRIQRFLDPSSGDTFNIDQALESFQRGGWFGTRPGRGHGQAHPAGKPHRFRVRGRRRGIRHRALPGAGRAVRLHRAARACATPCATRTRSRASPPPALPSCSGCNRRSTWR